MEISKNIYIKQPLFQAIYFCRPHMMNGKKMAVGWIEVFLRTKKNFLKMMRHFLTKAKSLCIFFILLLDNKKNKTNWNWPCFFLTVDSISLSMKAESKFLKGILTFWEFQPDLTHWIAEIHITSFFNVPQKLISLHSMVKLYLGKYLTWYLPYWLNCVRYVKLINQLAVFIFPEQNLHDL